MNIFKVSRNFDHSQIKPSGVIPNKMCVCAPDCKFDNWCDSSESDMHNVHSLNSWQTWWSQTEHSGHWGGWTFYNLLLWLSWVRSGHASIWTFSSCGVCIIVPIQFCIRLPLSYCSLVICTPDCYYNNQ